MGQPGIPILNKVGYSMFWNSMWDNKILYSRFFKEDIFLKSFFLLAFNDSLSVNTINFKNKQFYNYKRYTHILDLKKSTFYKHIFNINKVRCYSTKVWILKYQNWVILYHFLYLEGLNKKIQKSKLNYVNKDIFNLFKFYKKLNSKLNFSLLLKKKNFKFQKL